MLQTRQILKCLSNEKGVSATEYAMLAGMVSIAIVAVATVIGIAVITPLTTVLSALPDSSLTFN